MTIRPTPAGVRAVSAPLVLAALVALVAGCSSATSTPSSAPPAASQAATSAAASTPSAPGSPTSPATASSPTGSPGSGGTGAGGTPSCATRDLKVAAGLAQGAAGSVYQVIDFTNISGAPCTLFGYPGVALAGGSPVTQVGAAASRSGTSPARLVTLGANETGNALLRITQALNYPSSKCHPVSTTYLQIYPPNQTTPVYLGYKATACSSTDVKLLSVGVVQAGKGG